MNAPKPVRPSSVVDLETPHGQAMAGLRPCQCEHESHFHEGPGHPYQRADSGDARAAFVGPVCDLCALTCMADYLL